MMAACRANKPRPARLLAASSNGAIAIQFARLPAAVLAAASGFTSSFVHGRRWCLMSFFGAVTEAPSYVTPNGKWLPGKSGNPAGRPQGSRQKISNQLLADLESGATRQGCASALGR
jgi:hypothetical protein